MTSTPKDAKPPKKRFFSGRHTRGWIVLATIAGAAVFAGDALTITIATTVAGEPSSGVNTVTLVGMVACFSLAAIVGSARASDAVLSLTERLVIRAMHGKSIAVPPPADPNSWQSDRSPQGELPSE